jgi:hypothetical protein
VEELGLDPAIAQEFRDLYAFRLYMEGRESKPLMALEPAQWLRDAHVIVGSVEELANEQRCALSA